MYMTAINAKMSSVELDDMEEWYHNIGRNKLYSILIYSNGIQA